MANVWRQWETLPDQRVAEQGCSIAVDTSNHNQYTGTIGAAADTGDSAVCRTTDPADLPSGTEGYRRFWFTTPSGFSLANNSTILTILQSVGVQIVDIYIDSSLVLHVYSHADTINHTALNESTSLTLSSSTTYKIEVWWSKNALLKVNVDGVNKINDTTPSGSTGSCLVSEIRCVIDHYDGSASSGWSCVIDESQTGDSHSDSFDDPAVPVNVAVPVIVGTAQEGETLTASRRNMGGRGSRRDAQLRLAAEPERGRVGSGVGRLPRLARLHARRRRCWQLHGGRGHEHELVGVSRPGPVRSDRHHRGGCSDERDDARDQRRPGRREHAHLFERRRGRLDGVADLEYQWVSTSDDGLTQDDITGETAATYDAAVGELGLKVASLVTATNDGGAASAQTG